MVQHYALTHTAKPYLHSQVKFQSISVAVTTIIREYNTTLRKTPLLEGYAHIAIFRIPLQHTAHACTVFFWSVVLSSLMIVVAATETC
jgi:hypothetical protein